MSGLKTLSCAASLPYTKTVRYSSLTFAQTLLVMFTASICNNHWQYRCMLYGQDGLCGRKFASSAYKRLNELSTIPKRGTLGIDGLAHATPMRVQSTHLV